MAEVVNKPKRRGLSLESNKHRHDSASHGERSVGSNADQDASWAGHSGMHGETERHRPSFQAVTFTYLNPVSSSARLNQVIKYEQKKGVSQARHHEWLQKPVAQSFCHALNQPICNSVVLGEPQPSRQEKSVIPTDLLKSQKEELERIYAQKLEEKDRQIKELQESKAVQSSRIDFLHTELKSAQEKIRIKADQLRLKGDELRSKGDEINRLKDEHSRELQREQEEKERLKLLVVESQRTCLTSRTKQNRTQAKGQRRRLDVGRVNEIEAKLNRLISDIKK